MGPINSLQAMLVDPAISSDQDGSPRSTVHFLVAAGLPLLGMQALAKGMEYGSWSWWSLKFPFKLALVCYHDLLFVLGWLAVGLVLLTACRRPRRFQPIARGVFLALSAVVLSYAIANIWIYRAIRMPLTWPLLNMAGGMADVNSSLAPYLSLSCVSTVLAAPLIYLGLVYAMLRARWPGRRRIQLGLAILVLAYAPIGALGYALWYAGGPDDALAGSAHWAMIASCFTRWGSEESPHVKWPVAFQADFLPAGRRAMAGATTRPSGIRNLIVVVLESTSTHYQSVYGSAFPTTPCLKAEAANSLIFDNFYSNAGYTLHSMLPLILSIYPGNGWTIYASVHPHLAGTSAAEVLHQKGYRTAFMTGAMLEYKQTRRFFENRGFDEVYGCEDFQRAGVGTVVSSWGMDDPPLFDAMIRWIAQDPHRPFCLYVWTQQTHHPYAPGPGQAVVPYLADPSSERLKLLNLYLNDLRIADAQLGRLFAALREKHLADDTLVVITGDHGEAFGDPHPQMFHGTALYQESVNVPCIFWNPRLFSPGKRIETVGAHVDLNPTIFDLMGIRVPKSWQGTSLLARDHPPRAYFTCNTGNLLEGLREQNYKFIFNATLGREELYDLSSDPTEHTNLADRQPDRCKIYRQRISAWSAFEREHLPALVAQGGTLAANSNGPR